MDKFPSWRYGPKGQSGVFESEADVPAGWVDHPSLVKEAAAPAEPKTPAPAQPKPAAKKAGRPSKKAAKAAAPLDL